MGTGVRGPILWIPQKKGGGVRVETRRQLAGADGTNLGGLSSEGAGGGGLCATERIVFCGWVLKALYRYPCFARF